MIASTAGRFSELTGWILVSGRAIAAGHASTIRRQRWEFSPFPRRWRPGSSPGNAAVPLLAAGHRATWRWPGPGGPVVRLVGLVGLATIAPPRGTAPGVRRI